ncbi:DUF4097 family beta strand repeat-containing protein [Kutzneria sp. NPDC051319]|uniref:DUF4097 family beta strand repeat-containing protein n=1 Tax=Kutzneria sp. NPDC051319 TaxID=3155047 RepID=UPI00343E856D
MRTISHTNPGPVRLVLNLGPGTVRLIVEDRDTAEITLAPLREGDDVATDLITQAEVDHACHVLAVTVPRPSAGDTAACTVMQSAGGVRITQSHSVVRGNVTGLIITGGEVLMAGGRIAFGGATLTTGGQVRAEVRLPIGSSLTFDTDAADLYASGHLVDLVFHSQSGRLVADSIGTLAASTTSGGVGAVSVTTGSVKTMSGDVAADYIQTMRAQTMSGDVTLIPAAPGHRAEISTMSGDVRVTAHHDGHVDASTMSGDITVLAAQSRTVTTNTRSMSGRVRVPGTR